MKKLGVIMFGLLILVGCGGRTFHTRYGEKIAGTEAIVWAGLDYSMVRMIGTGDFHQPDAIFPGLLEKWNYLFLSVMREELQDKVGRTVKIDSAGMREINLQAKTSQIIREDGERIEYVGVTHISKQDIASAVQAYKLKNKQGIGLVFIMDRLVKLQELGCLYTVFFDVESREVLHSKRGCYEAGGFGFRNHWFSPVKEAVDAI